MGITEPSSITDSSPLAPALDLDATQHIPHKVHLRGLDSLTSSDLKSFASEYFNEELQQIEWIDDTSANLVYATPEVALRALRAFSAVDLGDCDLRQLPPLQLFPAKPYATNPETKLEVRLSVGSDRKRAGARDRSRFYLFNPEYDPSERKKRDFHSRRRRREYRDRDEGGYHRQHRDDFDASMYDDSDVARASRSHGRQDSKSSVSSEDFNGDIIRQARFPRGVGKELFPDRVNGTGRGRLRDRSASPKRESDDDRFVGKHPARRSRLRETTQSSTANRLQAQTIKSRLIKMEPGPKELFPQKISISRYRSDPLEEADITADLFAKKMPVPFVDGSNDISPGGRDLTSRISRNELENRISTSDTGVRNGYNIRGVAKQATEISIKGIAATAKVSVKELFPNKLGLNSGKELFSEKLEGRGRTRRRAEDMFY